MKQIPIALFILMLGINFCSAQQASVPAALTVATRVAETKSLTGKVESVTLADPVTGITSEIAITDKNGQKYIFLLKSITTIYDADWKAVTLDKVNKDEKVKVRYSTTKEGVNETISIRIINQ